MDPSDTHSHTAALIDRLGMVVPPGLAPFVAPANAAFRQVAFRFSYREVPCTAVSERHGDGSILRLVCNFGPLPYSVEGALSRRHLLQAMAAAKSDTGLDWRLSSVQSVVLTGDMPLQQYSTPAAMIASVVAVLLRADTYFGLLLEILGAPGGEISAPQAA